jgi:hypothetical protein
MKINPSETNSFSDPKGEIFNLDSHEITADGRAIVKKNTKVDTLKKNHIFRVTDSDSDYLFNIIFIKILSQIF